MEEISRSITKHNIHALVIIGGFEVSDSIATGIPVIILLLYHTIILPVICIYLSSSHMWGGMAQ